MSTSDSVQANGQPDSGKESEGTTEKTSSKRGSKAGATSALAVQSKKAAGEIEQIQQPRFVFGIRPIEPSNLEVIDTDRIPGHRPIFASHLHVIDTDSLPGHRPIVASDPALMHGSMLPGYRPIAANQVDDPQTLMGYLD